MATERQIDSYPESNGHSILQPSDTILFERLETYPWSTDDEFQSGLHAIIGDSTDPLQIRDLTLRARCFYYERRFTQPIDFNSYKTWYDRHSRLAGSDLPANDALPTFNPELPQDPSAVMNPPQQAALPEQPPPSHGFAEVMRMIQAGEQIPGIRDIPATVMEGQGSKPSQAPRRKPWEGTPGDRSSSQFLQQPQA